MNRRWRQVIALCGAAGLAAAVVPAAAQAAPVTRAETITVLFAGVPGKPAIVHARGAVTDNGRLTPNDSDVDTFVFKDGTLRIRETLTTKVGYPTPPLCVTTFRSHGSVRIVGGTGRFAGATGVGTASDTGLTVAPGDSCRTAPLFLADKATIHTSLRL